VECEVDVVTDGVALGEKEREWRRTLESDRRIVNLDCKRTVYIVSLAWLVFNDRYVQ
jgi:hypothetical protein